MATVEYDAQAVRRQLARALASASFTRSDRLSRFLQFVVERHLEGRDDELKESVIALEVFGNRDYDPKQDSIVRTEAGRLRARLAEYYVGAGGGDPLIIELPKGGYVPVFRRLDESGAGRKTHPQRFWLPIALAGLAVVLAATGWWLVHKSGPITIAVLPLHSLSQDPANEYFADGLTDEIIRHLSVIEGLAVRSQTSSFAFKSKARNVREAGRQLEADYILEGSVLPAGRQLRINAQLIRARDDFPVWSGRYDQEVTDVLAIQDEISRAIVNSLRLKLGSGPRRYETSAEAYDLYLRARAVRTQEGFQGSPRMIRLFEEAVAKDPSFAPAYAGLAAAYAFRSGTRAGAEQADQLPKMRAAAERAIQLDPLLAEAHDALGIVYGRDAQWRQSEKSFRRALELDPNNSTSHADFALNLLLPLNRVEEAVQQLRVAEKTDPLSLEVQDFLAYMLTSAGSFDEAVEHCQKEPADYPYKNNCLGRVRLGQGRTGEAIQILESSDRPGDRFYLSHAYARAGRREEAEKLIAAHLPNGFAEALLFAGLGDKDRTLEAMDRMAALGPLRIGRALTFPEFALLRGDPRVKALRRKVGLPE